jgi:hypothetical protein
MQLGWARQSKTSSWWSTSCARKIGADRHGNMVASAATRLVPERVIVVAGLDARLTDARVAELRGVRARTSAGEFSAQPPCGYHTALAWICRAVSVGFGVAHRADAVVHARLCACRFPGVPSGWVVARQVVPIAGQGRHRHRVVTRLRPYS